MIICINNSLFIIEFYWVGCIWVFDVFNLGVMVEFFVVGINIVLI